MALIWYHDCVKHRHLVKRRICESCLHTSFVLVVLALLSARVDIYLWAMPHNPERKLSEPKPSCWTRPVTALHFTPHTPPLAPNHSASFIKHILSTLELQSPPLFSQKTCLPHTWWTCSLNLLSHPRKGGWRTRPETPLIQP